MKWDALELPDGGSRKAVKSFAAGQKLDVKDGTGQEQLEPVTHARAACPTGGCWLKCIHKGRGAQDRYPVEYAGSTGCLRQEELAGGAGGNS